MGIVALGVARLHRVQNHLTEDDLGLRDRMTITQRVDVNKRSAHRLPTSLLRLQFKKFWCPIRFLLRGEAPFDFEGDGVGVNLVRRRAVTLPKAR